MVRGLGLGLEGSSSKMLLLLGWVLSVRVRCNYINRGVHRVKVCVKVGVKMIAYAFFALVRICFYWVGLKGGGLAHYVRLI